MKPFHYIRVETIAEAAEQLARTGPDARLLAGGTDLLIEWRRGKSPSVVIDISTIRDLGRISVANGLVSIGPLATHAGLAASADVLRHAHLLASAASVIGSPQIRNRGTVGGNIMNAAACADTVPPLVALDAEVTLSSRAGERNLKLADLFLKPYQTKAEPDEILTNIKFAGLPAGAKSSFIKLGRRNALSISRLSVAAVLVRDDAGTITEARLVPGATFPAWRRIEEAEKMLMKQNASKELFQVVGDKVSELMIAETGRRWSTEYKEPVIAVLVRRALEACTVPGKSR